MLLENLDLAVGSDAATRAQGRMLCSALLSPSFVGVLLFIVKMFTVSFYSGEMTLAVWGTESAGGRKGQQ